MLAHWRNYLIVTSEDHQTDLAVLDFTAIRQAHATIVEGLSAVRYIVYVA